MAWVSSTFGNEISTDKKENKRAKSYWKSSKKHCANLWVDEYPPSSLDDLALHKKKLEDVQNWLTESNVISRERRILLLTGPPGSSKSATIHALAKALNISLKEFLNPYSYSSTNETFKENYLEDFYNTREIEYSMNQSDRFSEFIFRASKYKNVCVEEKSSSLILIEEIPNVFIMRPYEFHEVLRKYSSSCTSPIVFIFSEISNSNLVKNLFPSEIQEELFITNIAFNPVSASLLQSALNRIVDLSSNGNSSFFNSVSMSKKQFLQMVAEKSGGDIRSAINTLQFMMMKGTTNAVSKKGKQNTKEKLSFGDAMGCKDSSLVLFRALGKILYCKRQKIEKNSVDSCGHLPHHLRNHERDALIEDPDDVFERSGSRSTSFNLFLHQNCTPFFSDINDFSAAIKYLSDADIFNSTWDPFESLEVYSSSVAVRGMMHSLKGNEKGAPKTFRSLTRPAWYNFVKTSNERLERAKRLNRDLPINNEELSSLYIPFLAKISLSISEADKFLREVGLLFPPSFQAKPSDKIVSLSTETTSEANRESEDEEFVIEEFDD